MTKIHEALLTAAQNLITAQDELRQFERENPNNTTKQWSSRLYAVGDAEEALRKAVAKARAAP